MRVASCGVGLDLVWARRYRSRLQLPAEQTPLGNNWDHSYNIYVQLPGGEPQPGTLVGLNLGSITARLLELLDEYGALELDTALIEINERELVHVAARMGSSASAR